MQPAREGAEKALQRYPSEQNEWHWRFRVLKAEILARQGSYAESLDLLNAEPPPSFAATDFAIRRKLVQAIASAWLRKPVDVNALLADGEALARAHHPELLGELALARGAIAYLGDNPSAAAAGYRDALQLSRARNDLYVQTFALAGLALVAIREAHYDEALDWNQTALHLAESQQAQSALAQIPGNMAWCYLRLGDFDNALSFYKRAAGTAASANLRELQIYWLTGIANVYHQQHDYAAAEAVLTQSLDLARKGSKRTLIKNLNDLAEVELERGKIDSADGHYQEAAGEEQGSPDHSEVVATRLIRGRIDVGRHDYADAKESLQAVIHDSQAEPTQRWEGQARLAQVYAEEGHSSDADKEFRQSLESIETVRSSVRAEDLRMSFIASGIDLYDEYVAFLMAQGRTQDALQVAELSRARTLAEGLGMAPKALSFAPARFHPKQIAQHEHATLLFYWLGQVKSYLWVITPLKVDCLTLPGAPQIDALVKAYSDAVVSGRDVLAAGNTDGAQLYKMLVAPAQKLIPANARVILLPDGSLYGLNFETLLVPEPSPHFWIDDVTVSTASSLKLLSAARAAAGAAPRNAGNLLLVGNPTEAAPEFPVLRQAKAEITDVSSYFPEARREVLAGPQATPAAFLGSSPEKFAYVHFVTHGTASRSHPLDSAVILSPQGDAYKLYARDIVQHPLSAYLVTVSACNGSGTRAYSGEGLVGLSWAFLRAGAHNVIAALWEVNDVSTPQLMDHLYAELSRGRDPASALHAAKLVLLHSGTVFQKPFYWAAFQLYSGS